MSDFLCLVIASLVGCRCPLALSILAEQSESVKGTIRIVEFGETALEFQRFPAVESECVVALQQALGSRFALRLSVRGTGSRD